MNWLAHLYLARQSEDAMLGALLGDFVFGSSGLERYGAVVRREILLHRRIDAFTDSHPAVTALRARFPDGRRRYAGIALDVYFDHLLARDWARWSTTPLDAFTARAYAMLDAHDASLPPRLQAIAPSMAARDWLGGYRHRGSVDLAVRRIAGRLSRHGERLVGCLEDLRGLEAEAGSAFESLFPALCGFVEAERAQPAGRGGPQPPTT
ncbi:MAG: ACP phosphodiesterase [Pseudomonadota bacterium]